jgi:arylsulfatase A-like enzyme
MMPTTTEELSPGTDRPNILWFVSEDNNPYVGAYGDPVARTPTIDALAADGVLFRNFIVTSPVCAPVRFGIITGMYETSCGPAQHMRASGNTPGFLRGFPSYLTDAGYYTSNNDKTDYNSAAMEADAGWSANGPAAHYRDRPAGSPFFAVFNTMTTHEGHTFSELTTEPPSGRTDPSAVRVPSYLPDTETVRHDLAQYYDLMSLMDAELATFVDELQREGVADDTILFYYGDHGGVAPRSKRFCYDSGLHTPLVVRFPPKWAHLAPAPPGSVIEAPVTSVDLAPTVLSLAAVAAPAYFHGQPFAGPRVGDPRQYVISNRNRMDERYDMVRTVRDERYRYIRNYLPHLAHGQHIAFMWRQACVREWESLWERGELNDAQAAFWNPKPAEELYDLEEDPYEVTNLIDAPEHRIRVDDMRRALDRHLLEVNDNGFIPEGSPLEGYDQSRVPGAYPLPDILELAATATQRDPANLPVFASMLDHPNEVMRYWAALGCGMLGKDAVEIAPALEACMTGDASVQVRVAAAGALGRAGGTDRAVTFLAHVAASSDEHDRVRLQAVNALTELGDHARPALPQLQVAESSPDYYLREAARYLVERLSR